MRIFLALILNFVLFHCLLCLNATIVLFSLKTKWNKKFFQDRPKIFLFFKSYMTLLYLLIIVFFKI